MIKTPLVSVIVTTFNRRIMLSEAIKSILEQSMHDFELIIIDNMSDDGTEKYIAKLRDCRIRYYRNSNDGIIAKNRNYGIEKAKGIYVAFCDDDDLWMRNKLYFQVRCIRKKSNLAMCFTRADYYVNNKKIDFFFKRKIKKNIKFYDLLRGNLIPNSSVLVKKSVFYEIGMLNESKEIREDYEMWLRVARRYCISGIDIPLIKYRIHSSNSAEKKTEETMKAIKTLATLVKPLEIPHHVYLTNIAIQYFKFFIYLLFSKIKSN
jgi:glycosyltransferase involved in cell wall biosynthesis